MAAERTALAQLRNDFGLRNVVPTVVAGVISGVILVALTVSIAAFVFRGDIADGLPVGIGMALFGTLVVGVVTTLGTGLAGSVAGVQDNTAAVIGVAVAAIVAGVAPDRAVPTAIAFIVVTSVATAAALAGLGLTRLGKLVRYVPFPVVGGFLVATGVVLADGAFAVLFDGGSVTSFDAVTRWVPGVGLAGMIVVVSRRPSGRVAVPWLIAGAIAVFHVVRIFGGVSVAGAAGRGWTLGPFSDASLWRPDVLRVLGDADWGAIGSAWGSVFAVIALAAISLMIKMQALDQALGEDVDVDRELTVAGLATGLGVLGGGSPGFTHFSQTILLRSVAGPNRGAALVAALSSGGVLVAGAFVLELIPVFVLGAMLGYLASGFLIDWLWDQRKSLLRAEYALVLGAGVAVIAFGFLAAVAAGTVVAIVLFVIRYSRVDAVRHAFDLQVVRSTTDRPPGDVAVLEAVGSHAVVLEVHGFLFFGTAYRVFADQRIDNRDGDLRFAIFDLEGVTGIDSSAASALGKLARRAEAEGFGMVLAGLGAHGPGLLAQLRGHAGVVTVFETIDGAIEWCEERILEESAAGGGASLVAPGTVGLLARLVDLVGSHEHAESVLRHFERRVVDAGDVVVEQGSTAPGLSFIESGLVRAELVSEDGSVRRLRRMQASTLVGEISLYLGGSTTASVVAEGPTIVLHLSPEALAEVEVLDPVAAAAIHRFAASVLAERVIHSERALRRLRQ